MSQRSPRPPSPPIAYLLAIAACGSTALVAMPLRQVLDLANMIMLFLLVVFMVALHLGRGPAVLAALASVALFDFVFVPPHLAFIPTDAQYLITLIVMLAVALVTAQLIASTREQSLLASAREHQTGRLYRLARDLAGARTRGEVQIALDAYFQDSGRRAVLLCPGEEEERASTGDPSAIDVPVAHLDQQLSLPLCTPTSQQGLLVISGSTPAEDSQAQEQDKLEAVASLSAIALERLCAVTLAEDARLQAASDKLRASVLSALSHDLRTPLTALVGMADSLALGRTASGMAPEEAAAIIRDQARSMEHQLGNLLEMARLQAGRVVLHQEWQLMDDVISAGLRQLRLAQNNHAVRVRVAPDMPLVRFDAVLMERVVWNLLENAVKYSPADAPVEVVTDVDAAGAWLAVCDRGPGFPPERLESVFDLFVRGSPESPLPGVGLGLAICRAIVEAHGGTIRAENRPDGGACVRLWLPLGNPPPFIEEEPEESLP